MNEQNTGKYDNLYDDAEVLWPAKPGRVLNWMLRHHPAPKRVIDIGCGDGKNAVFLAEQGAQVECFDVSQAALNAFSKRLSKHSSKIRNRVSIAELDVCSALLEPSAYDCAVFYGVGHCLNDQCFDNSLALIEKALSTHGWLCFCAFNSDLPVPAWHNTGKLTLRHHDVILRSLRRFDIVMVERGTITESHVDVSEHSHALTWVLARKNE